MTMFSAYWPCDLDINDRLKKYISVARPFYVRSRGEQNVNGMTANGREQNDERLQ
jgi:hypothetical protein